MMYLIIIGFGIWVYFDAKAIGARKGLLPGFFNIGPIGWALGTMLLWIIVFPLYLIKRGDIKAKAGDATAGGATEEQIQQNNVGKPTTLNSITKYTALGWSFFCIVGAIYGLAAVGDMASSSTEPGMQAGMAIGAGIGMGMWFFAWVAITIPATVIFFLTKKSGTVVAQPAAPPALPAKNTRKCPYCAETIKKEAKFCRFCKQNLSEKKPVAIKEPRTPPPDPLAISKQHLQNKEYKDAVITLTTLIKQEPRNKLAYYFRAVAYSKVKEKKNMIFDLEKSAELGHKKAQETLEKFNRK